MRRMQIGVYTATADTIPDIIRIGKAVGQWPRSWDDVEPTRLSTTGVIVETPWNWIVGYGHYELIDRSRCELVRVVIDPAFRRRGYGTAVVRHVARLAGMLGRERLVVSIDEMNLDGQRFYHACGFRAFKVDRGQLVIDGVKRDAYRMAMLAETGADAACRGR